MECFASRTTDGIKNYISDVIVQLSSNEDSFQRERLYVNKLNIILVQVLKHEWPARWQSFVPDLVSAAKSSETICENCMAILKDNNLGLVKQVLSSLYKRNIQRLTQTYLTLSLQDIANAVQLKTPKEAEMHVLRMVDGEIFATINQKDGMVSFYEDLEQYKTCEMAEHIDSTIQSIMAIELVRSQQPAVNFCNVSLTSFQA
uniref:COP9 signalosome complex subunit 3 n=1 Tax=Ananas comosus var. bracteatus TaxID=296719 RepID=A0A6V7QGE4_ANACO|nr:unnamed protein product [Ananas comosus var. bracteatus]